MHRPVWKVSPIIVLLAGLLSCGKENPVQPPQNRNPVLSSLIAFPNVINPGDSTIVIASAADPDGDPLVFDWVTDSRFVIKGNSPSNHERYNSPSNLQVFYYGDAVVGDSAWVECDVRDGRGGFTPKQARIYTAP